MTTALSPFPVLRFCDNNGNALSGGKLFTYAAGTTTKQATYTDSTGGTPNTNPVILNTRGEANVWLAPGENYKFVLSPSTDSDPPTNPIWTVDNIAPSDGISTAMLPVVQASTTQAAVALLNYLGSASGEVVRTLLAKLGDVKTLLDFGADPTGTNDSTSAIQAAFTWAGSTGGTLGSSPGIYKISSPLTLMPDAANDPTYFRPGPEINLGQRCYIQAAASMAQMLTVGSNASDYSGIVRNWMLKLGTWDCNNLANIGILVAFANNCRIRDTKVRNQLTYAFQGGSAGSPTPSFEIYFEDCRTDRTVSYLNISGITKANPGVVTTATPHGLSNGAPVFIQGVGGMTQINGVYYTVTVIDSTHFSLASSNPASVGINTSSYSAYTSGGTVSPCAPTGTAGIFYDNASDYAVTNCVLTGNQIGVTGNASGATDTGLYDGKALNVHIWNYPENGELLYGFDFWGDTHTVACQVDASFQYAFHFRSARNSLVSCEVNYGGSGSFANHAYPILLETGAGVTAVNCDWKNTNTNTDLVAEATGDLTNYISFANSIANVSKFGARGPNTVNTWAYCTAGASPTINEGQNVNSIVQNNTGDYTLITANALDTNASITVTGATSGGTPIIGVEYQGMRSSAHFRVLFFNLSGTLTDPTTFSVQVVQGLPSSY